MSRVTDLANRCFNASGILVVEGQNYRKSHILNEVVPKLYAQKHKECTYHMHDLENYDVTYNCIGVRVEDLLGKKTRTLRNALRELNRKIVDLANCQSGGIGFINFDSDIKAYITNETDNDIREEFHEFFLDLNNFSRRGCENPYVTLNFGLDTIPIAQRVSLLLLDAFERGDEMGNPLIFPNLAFKLKSGVNVEEDTPNYCVYQRALQVTAKRMIPTYFNCDSPINKGVAATEIGIMGCRTRVVSNINGREGAKNRGNVACVTLNLVQMAYQAKGNRNVFYELLEENLQSAKEALLHRFDTLCQRGTFDAFYENGYYLNSEKHNAYEMLKNGTLSIGFVGLWDAIQTLYNKKFANAEDVNEYLEEGYKIIQHMNDFTENATLKEGLNFSVLASPAEGVTGRFAQYDSEHLGRNHFTSEKGFYTNSFHVPVDLPIHYREKIEIESRFHALCNGGSITYIELKEMPGRNIEAVQEIVEYAYQNGCNYIGINFPLDNCLNCNYIGRMVDECPICASKNIRRLRRVSGYLAEENSFTKGKKKEVKMRVSHIGIV